jgi:signal recognition particle subunit SEC65
MGKILLKGRKIKKNAGIFSATLKDIEKALEKLNQRKPPTDPKIKLF